MVSNNTFSCLQCSHVAKTFVWVLYWSQHVLLQNIEMRPCRTDKEVMVPWDGFSSSMSASSLPGDRKAPAWCWIVCCTGDRSAWKGHQPHPLLISAAHLQVLWLELGLGQREKTGLWRKGPVQELKYDWDGDPGGGLKTRPEGQEGLSWQGMLVWGHNGPREWRFHWPGLALSSGQIAVTTQRKMNNN